MKEAPGQNVLHGNSVNELLTACSVLAGNINVIAIANDNLWRHNEH